MESVVKEVILTDEMGDLVEYMEDTRDKLFDCTETVKAGKLLDTTQTAFLKDLGML